ncbi:hypothetical protein MNB_SV-15-77 [hydrothermal vent metagenome]|uniref:Uncharacterized protein n=1 Tax=hydrothermal vent metagenome TaxID=652676 RepID=A0A1W1EI56_9ZZZZ
MQTIQLDIQDDKLNTFLTIIDNLKSGIIEQIRFEKDIFNIESIAKDTEDFYDIESTKKENNKKYSIEEAKAKLGLI